MDSMILQGKNVPMVRAAVPVNKCIIDATNPRIQYLIGQRAGSVSQAELDSLIWEKDAVKTLSQSIFQNGGVYEPVIVQRQGDKFHVREGNCRTVACRHLLEQHPKDIRFETMPAMIFDVDLTGEDLAVLLADMHVAGKIRWDAFEQAKHVHDLFTVYGKTYEWLSNHLRLSKSKITEFLSAYRATHEYLATSPTKGNVRKFSIFHEIMKKKDLRQRFADDETFKQQIHKWVKDEKINDAKQVRHLSAILEKPAAAKALDVHGFDAATKVLIKEDPSIASDLFWAIKSTAEQLRNAPASDIKDLKTGNPQKIIMLRELHRAIEDLATLAEVKL